MNSTVRVADYIIDFLAQQGVKDFFTVSGGGSIFLCDALALNKSVNYICCHHEQAVSMASESYARVRNGLGVSIVTTGPGGTNAITGVAGAWIDSVPNLILSGQAFLNQTIGDSGLRQLGVQEINIIDLVKPITKYAVIVEDPQTIRFHLEKAIYLANSGRPGPVWLDLPANIQNAKIDPNTLVGFVPEKENLEIKQKANLEIKNQVAQIVSWLKESKRPLIHVGQGIRLAGLAEEFISLAEQYNLPFVTSRNINDLVASDHPLYIGRPGTFAQRYANFALQTADFYLALGTRLSLPQTGYNAKDFAKNARKAMVDLDRAELDKKTLALDLKVCADLRDFLPELKKQLLGLKFDTTKWINKCAEWKKRYPVVTQEQRDQKELVNSYHFIDLLSDVLDSNDTIVTDMGIAFQGTHQALRVKKGQRFFTNSGFASMGWGLPGAIGACFGNNKKRTICISGDGGLMMNIQELATVKHHNLPIKLFILNNNGYLTIKQTQELGFQSRYMGVDAESGLYFPSFELLAKAHQLDFLKVDSHKNLIQNIEKVVNNDKPFVCEIIMESNQMQGPKAINRRNPDGTMSPTPLEDLFPFIEREELEEIMGEVQ